MAHESTLAALAERVAKLEQLLGVDQFERAEWLASLDLNNQHHDPGARVPGLRRLRVALFAELAETPEDGEIEWRLGVVDRAIRANTNTTAPEHRLDALETEHAILTQTAARPWRASTMPGMPSQEEHDQRVASAKRRLGDVDAEIERTRDELANLYQEPHRV